MAVAALSLAQQDGTARLDALQHYQQALPALQFNLRSADDLYSDGGFLTHFMLLVYEVRFSENMYLGNISRFYLALLAMPVFMPILLSAPTFLDDLADKILFRSLLPNQVIQTSGRNTSPHFYRYRWHVANTLVESVTLT